MERYQDISFVGLGDTGHLIHGLDRINSKVRRTSSLLIPYAFKLLESPTNDALVPILIISYGAAVIVY